MSDLHPPAHRAVPHPIRHSRSACSIALLCGLFLSIPAMAADEKPLASTSLPNGSARVEVLSLKRTEGDLVTLRWSLVNEDTKDISMTAGNAELVDLVARRKYSAGLTGNRCAAPPGKRALCWATFAAPPAGTKTMSVNFYEAAELVPGVPVSN